MTRNKEKNSKQASRPENYMATLKRLLSYIKNGYKLRFTAVVVCIILSSLGTVAAALFLQQLIDNYIEPMVVGVEGVGFADLAQALLVMGLLLAVSVAATLLYNYSMVKIGQGIQKQIRDQMFAHMQQLPLGYFDSHSHGDVMSYYTNDIDTLRQLLSQSVPTLVSSAFTVLATLCAMIATNLWLTLVELIGVFFVLQAMRAITSRSGKYFMRQQQSMATLNGYIEEMVHGQRVVKVFCHEAQAKEGFDRLNDDLCHNATRANIFANILMPIMGNSGNLIYTCVGLVGGLLAVAGVGGLTLGGIATFIQLTRSFIMPISQMGQQINFVVMGVAGAERIFRLMDEPVEQDQGDVTLVNITYDQAANIQETQGRSGYWAWKVPEANGYSYRPLSGDVRLHDVDFAYEAGKPVLRDIEIYAYPGQKVAFVGATGAGKTTITNLLNRFYDIQKGSITYDDIDIARIQKHHLRRSLGLVLQDVNLFTGTVMENIRYGRLDATDEEVIAAAKLANAHDFISRLPEGYQTELTGDGSGLSQGQRQLISIARAAVSQPPVMILDEATSSIDTRTEALVQAGMDSLMKGRTVFVIAHRLSTVKNADVIMVLDHGRIIERGSHEKLLSEQGVYWQLYTGAFELE